MAKLSLLSSLARLGEVVCLCELLSFDGLKLLLMIDLADTLLSAGLIKSVCTQLPFSKDDILPMFQYISSFLFIKFRVSSPRYSQLASVCTRHHHFVYFIY